MHEATGRDRLVSAPTGDVANRIGMSLGLFFDDCSGKYASE